jgi:hypothetical protein
MEGLRQNGGQQLATHRPFAELGKAGTNPPGRELLGDAPVGIASEIVRIFHCQHVARWLIPPAGKEVCSACILSVFSG